MITIPYWWNLEKSSLMATIYQMRPDLVHIEPHWSPIPEHPPEKDVLPAAFRYAPQHVATWSMEYT